MGICDLRRRSRPALISDKRISRASLVGITDAYFPRARYEIARSIPSANCVPKRRQRNLIMSTGPLQLELQVRNTAITGTGEGVRYEPVHPPKNRDQKPGGSLGPLIKKLDGEGRGQSQTNPRENVNLTFKLPTKQFIRQYCSWQNSFILKRLAVSNLLESTLQKYAVVLKYNLHHYGMMLLA